MKDAVDSWQTLDGTRLEMRPMRASDEAQVKASLNKLSGDSRRNRFFASIAEFSDTAVHQLVAIDPASEYLLVVLRREDDVEIPIAGGRFVHEEEHQEHGDRHECAVSLLIGDPWQGQGIGRRLLQALIREASRRGLRRMYGHVLADNRPMLALARSQHFTIGPSDQGANVLQIARELPERVTPRWKALLRRFLR